MSDVGEPPEDTVTGSRGESTAPSEYVEVHWFLPLPEPIAMPETADEPLSFSFPKEGQTQGDDVLMVFLVAHHRIRPWPTPDATDDSFAVMHEVLPELARVAEEEVAERPFGLAVTVMHAVVAYPPGENVDQGRLSDGFDRALEAIAMVQRGYHAATKRPVTIIQREKLPPILPWAKLTSLNGIPGRPEMGIMMVHDMIPAMEPPSPLTEEEWTRTMWAIGAEITPFLNYVDLRREAVEALRRGEHGTACVLFATASEVFLETLLLHLIWSEGKTPEAAAALFENRGLASRVKTEYHGRLGGPWAETGTGPVAVWFKRTAIVRHRVVHAGYRPSRAESIASLEAMSALEKFVADKLCTPSRMKIYPATALALAGEGGLRRRKKPDAVISGLLENAKQWLADFVVWNAKVITLRMSSDLT